MNKITEDKKPHPKEVEVVENSKNTSLDNTGKLHDLAKVIKKNQEAIKILKLELSDKDRVIKEIIDKLYGLFSEFIKVRRPPIRPPYFYEKTGEDNPYLYDDFEYWQIDSIRPSPLPKSWLLNLEKSLPSTSTEREPPKRPKLPKILSKQAHYRSNSTNKNLLASQSKT